MELLSIQKKQSQAEDGIEPASRMQLARALSHASRRVLVAAEDLKVRRGVDLSSQFITTLPAGSRCIVVETRRTQDGGQQRAHVMVAGADRSEPDDVQRAMQTACRWRQLLSPNKPLGWVTERGREGESLLREPQAFRSSPMGRTAGGPSDFNSQSTPTASSRSTSTASSRAGVARASIPVRASAAPAVATIAEATPATPAIVATVAPNAPADGPAPAKKFSLGKLGGLKSLLSKAVAAEGVAVPAALAKEGGEPSSSDFASLVKAAVREFSCPGSGLSLKSAHLAVEEACTLILKLYSDKMSNVFRVSDVQAAVAKFEQAALDEEKAANGTSLSAQIGEVLSAKGAKKIDDLVKEWDPNGEAVGPSFPVPLPLPLPPPDALRTFSRLLAPSTGDGSVTKQEFRLCVRKLFKKPPETKVVDALFKTLDADGGGELDMGELKAALKNMMSAHSNRKAAGATAMVKVAAKREQAKALREGSIAAAVTDSEAAVAALQKLRRTSSIESQLGDIINSKGWKASDVATKWDASGDGELDKKEVSGYPSALAMPLAVPLVTASPQSHTHLVDACPPAVIPSAALTVP